MMKKIILDLTKVEKITHLHRYLADQLKFPDYYGGNLDALYDQLTDICEDVCLGVFMPVWTTEHAAYPDKIKKVIKQAEADNDHLTVIFGNLEDN